ncbi:MAG: DNA methyltransferase [Methanomassiliicoccales archaeon]|jgi:DNA modification methylase|nr:DNA methyltransferase [Methanomassiliicoccales archaeon]
MKILTDQDYSWLPTKRTCSCKPTRLNCLSRKEISQLGSTVLNVNKRHVWKDSHPARFIPELPEKYIRLFSHPGETVLDPFCGSGTTNVVAFQLGRNSAGIDINPFSVMTTIERLRDAQTDSLPDTTHLVLEEDCRKIMEEMPDESIDLIVTSPPYFDVVNYNHEHPGQLGNIHDYSTFLSEMERAFEGMMRVLKPEKYAIVNTQDLFKKNAKCPIHSDYIQIAKKIGLELININIYILNYSTGGRLVYGYPVAYFPKNDHEYILIFKKKRT